MQIMGARSIFSMGGQIRGLETKVPPAGSRDGTPVGRGTKPPKADDRL